LRQVTGSRRFSQAISEGDGISVVAEIDGPEAARRAEAEGAEALLVYSGHEASLGQIRAAVSLPILFYWDGQNADRLEGADACIVDVGPGGAASGPVVEQAHSELDDSYELALRVGDEEQLEGVLEQFDPELFVLAGKDEGALERVLELLPDVPAGKLAIAELPRTTREAVEELERAGVDAVIVHDGNVAELVGGSAPEV
jgi:NAD(P)H-dependent flavin oxidoreductase YrpB (nitropropane dioxygenase family)